MYILPSEGLGGTHVRLHGVTISNNREQMPCSLIISISHHIQPLTVYISRGYMPCSLLLLFLIHTQTSAILNAHPVCSVSRIRHHVCRVVATLSASYNTLHWKLVLFMNFHLELSSHPSHTAILLQSESLSKKYATIYSVAASNKRDRTLCSLFPSFSHHIQQPFMISISGDFTPCSFYCYLYAPHACRSNS